MNLNSYLLMSAIDEQPSWYKNERYDYCEEGFMTKIKSFFFHK